MIPLTKKEEKALQSALDNLIVQHGIIQKYLEKIVRKKLRDGFYPSWASANLATAIGQVKQHIIEHTEKKAPKKAPVTRKPQKHIKP